MLIIDIMVTIKYVRSITAWNVELFVLNMSWIWYNEKPLWWNCIGQKQYKLENHKQKMKFLFTYFINGLHNKTHFLESGIIILHFLVKLCRLIFLQDGAAC